MDVETDQKPAIDPLTSATTSKIQIDEELSNLSDSQLSELSQTSNHFESLDDMNHY